MQWLSRKQRLNNTMELNDEKALNHLQELGNSDYEISNGQPDITGWGVLNSEGIKLGEVQDLLFDPAARKVRYVVVQLQANSQDIVADDRNVLIPIGVTQLLSGNKQVIIPLASAEPLNGLPSYQSGNLTPETEIRIRQVFDGGSTAPYEHPQFYAHAHFDEDNFYGNFAAETDLNDEDPVAAADRASRAHRIVERIESSENAEMAAQPSFEGAAGEYNRQDTVAPEPESIEQEEAWQEELQVRAGSSKLMEFFVDQLKDLLWAERELVQMLPDMAEAATSQELKGAFTTHLAETVVHVTRLHQIFGILGLEPETKMCDAMAGIVDEGDSIISDTDAGSAHRDVGLIFAGQKAEHYEIASYGGMVSLAKTLGYYEIAELLVQTLDEEKSADALLTEIAENHVNYDAGNEPV